jgi:APA family basic amino acid/polyamine antiporter
MGILSPGALGQSSAPFAEAGTRIWGGWAGALIAAGAAISAFGALNGWILLQGQMPLAAARDGLFPKVFGKLSARGTPVYGLVISSVLITGLMALNFTASLVDQFTFLILLATLSTLIPYVLSAVSELVMMVRDREQFSGQRLKGAATIAVLALGYSLWAIVGVGWETVLWGLLLLAAGVPFYLWQKRRNPKQPV